jgi:anthranilate synthase/aminodeoxychorismate synthase-like glutamine amidotransferase
VAASVLLIDNYDSFTYNLVQQLGELGARPTVFRNDAIDLPGIRRLAPQAVIISPGPGRPDDGGISLAVAAELSAEIPTLGVCLGHQCVGEAFGATVVRAPQLMHGKTSEIFHDGTGVFAGLPSPFTATRYHSLIVDRSSLPDELVVTAETADGIVMGLRHRHRPLYGVQFHPESILTPSGPALLANFLVLAGQPAGAPGAAAGTVG